MRSVFHGWWTCFSSTELNRRMRTRMSGGVAGESGRPLPLCRLPVDAPAPSEDYPFPLPTRAVRWNSIPIELTSFIKDGALRFGDRELSGDWLLRP